MATTSSQRRQRLMRAAARTYVVERLTKPNGPASDLVLGHVEHFLGTPCIPMVRHHPPPPPWGPRRAPGSRPGAPRTAHTAT